MHTKLIRTRAGAFAATFSTAGLAMLEFPGGRNARAVASRSRSGENAAWIRQTRAALDDGLAGRDPRELPPLDLAAGTDFQRRVWRELLKIPSGRTRSYGEVASRLGKPGAARAVGAACGANPVPVLVPCHRVLASNRTLGGFSGGVNWKQRLLAAEGVGVGGK
ncbi:MAG: methylated-DNA--[protein]-cysteine S-methyltransferase [Verrucomicrobia bacterium]|nr:methylated-DNA--[protein]-cysteine S-methyltransferase [Verrucomicrobiota bacterium]